MINKIFDQWNGLKRILWEKYVLEAEGTRVIINILRVIFFLEFFAFLVDLYPADYWFAWIEKVVEYNTALYGFL